MVGIQTPGSMALNPGGVQSEKAESGPQVCSQPPVQSGMATLRCMAWAAKREESTGWNRRRERRYRSMEFSGREDRHLTKRASAARALRGSRRAILASQYRARRLPSIERALASCMRWLGWQLRAPPIECCRRGRARPALDAQPAAVVEEHCPVRLAPSRHERVDPPTVGHGYAQFGIGVSADQLRLSGAVASARTPLVILRSDLQLPSETGAQALQCANSTES